MFVASSGPSYAALYQSDQLFVAQGRTQSPFVAARLAGDLGTFPASHVTVSQASALFLWMLSDCDSPNLIAFVKAVLLILRYITWTN